MIAYLSGKLVEKSPSVVVIDVGGVGYEVFVSLTTYDRLPATGSACRLLIYEKIAEDAHTLYGFAEASEKSLFERLVSVSGIGPKIALGALSGLTAADLSAAIVHGDSKRLATLHGIGKRTAERIVVELKDKINPLEVLSAATPGDAKKNAVLRDTVLALTSLGFPEDQATKMAATAVEKHPEVTHSDELLRLALGGH